MIQRIANRMYRKGKQRPQGRSCFYDRYPIASAAGRSRKTGEMPGAKKRGTERMRTVPMHLHPLSSKRTTRRPNCRLDHFRWSSRRARRPNNAGQVAVRCCVEAEWNWRCGTLEDSQERAAA